MAYGYENFPAILPVALVRNEIGALPYIAQRNFYKTEETTAPLICVPHAEFKQNVLCNFQSIFLGKLLPGKIIAHRDFKDVILVSKLFAGCSSHIHIFLI